MSDFARYFRPAPRLRRTRARRADEKDGTPQRNSSSSTTAQPSTGTPSAASAAASSSCASGAAFHASPQPAATSPGTGIMRPGSPRRRQHSSHDIAAAVVGNVTTRDGTRTRLTAGPYGLTTRLAPVSRCAITYMLVTSPTASVSAMP